MATKQAQKAAGLTPVRGREVMAAGETLLTPPLVTKRAYKPRARKCACGCGKVFTPPSQAPRKRFYDDACRKRAARRRAAKQRPAAPKAAPVLVLMECQFCGVTFLGVEGKGGKYCKPAHRVAAAEARRAAAIEAAVIIVGSVGGLTPEDVTAFVEREGMRKVSAYLRQQGMVYSEADRRWLVPVEQGCVFVGAHHD